MPLLKYFLTIGSLLFGGLLAVSYALGPPTDSHRVERRVIAAAPKDDAPKRPPALSTTHEPQATSKQVRIIPITEDAAVTSPDESMPWVNRAIPPPKTSNLVANAPAIAGDAIHGPTAPPTAKSFRTKAKKANNKRKTAPQRQWADPPYQDPQPRAYAPRREPFSLFEAFAFSPTDRGRPFFGR
jgi:hypothetical protein